MAGELVLVTGGSGFVGAECVAQLLDAGYRVRTTVRSLSRESEVRALVASGRDASADVLGVVEANLLSDDGWADAVANCDFVLHVASPFPVTQPKDEDDLIIPARDGALRVLRAARDAGVKRVVLTSSFAAIGYGHPPLSRPYTEQDWTDVNGESVSAYAKSKTIAERAAWNFVADEGETLQLAVVNPVAVFGPARGTDLSTSVQLLRRLLMGAVPALPRISLSAVDVRDVADLHLRALTHPDAAGERFIASAGPPVSFPEIAHLLRERLADAAKHVPSRILPNWVVRAGAPLNSTMKQLASQLGAPKLISNDKARLQLGWSPRSNEESLLSAAESLVRLELLTKQGS
ncbi:SDR family oxidoreductase [Glaciibacter psychrotolerans]|uniref:Dihydroflavonol-4-reductase n=1 Tax=Glaciibacter psychrotolerans TaxID=670054 RepID=A0A7Z0J530_9MICO|nr:aldehyde reductase [Leifsonia psychrotolerans]NYJ18997.1 dihydroflavonol-4-reductase [Leifsonia psychrotolerans]